jgi:diguanylate cyclase (GGDEF)-like protein
MQPWRHLIPSAILACLAATAGLASAPVDDKERIRQLIVQAEATSVRDLGGAATLAEQAFVRAEAAGARARAVYAQLTWADALLKGRKLDEGDALLKRIESALGASADPATESRLVVLRARWLRDLNRIEAAEQAFLRATELAERAGDEGQLAIVLNSHAAMLWRQAQTERSTRLLERALAINQRLGRDGEAVKNLSYLSLIARDRGDFDLALRLNEQILSVSERRDDLRAAAVAANTIGLLRVQLGEMREALTYFRKAEQAYRQVGDPSGEGPALANIGTTLIETKQYDEADPPLRRALQLALSSNDPTAEVSARSALAELALGRGDLATAATEAMAALAASGRQPAPSPGHRAHGVLADVKRRQGDLDAAIAHGRLALEQARLQGRKSIVLSALTGLAGDLAARGRHADAYALMLEASRLIDQIRDGEVRREIARTEAAYAAKQRESELAAQAQRIDLLEAQADQQRSIRLLLAVALGTFVLLVAALASRMLLKRRNERQLLTYTAEIERANRELAEAADTDVLTRARNRRYFQQQLAPRLQQRLDAGTPFALVLIDADHFKAINDRHGHDVGDRALVAIAETWRGVLGPDDTLVRWGGEEFLVVVQAEDAGAADLVRRGMAATRRIVLEGADLSLSVSAGWLAAPWPGADLATLLQIADRAMLLAKREGRDRAIGVRHDRPLQLAAGHIPEDLADVPGVVLRRER